MAAVVHSRSSSTDAGSLKPSSRACHLVFELLEIIQTQGFLQNAKPPVPVPCVKELTAAGDILLLAAATIGSRTCWLWQQRQQQQKYQKYQQQQASLPEPHHAQLLRKLGCLALEHHRLSVEHVSCEKLSSVTSTTGRLLGGAVEMMQQQQQLPLAEAINSNNLSSNSSSICCRDLPGTELMLVLMELLVLLPPNMQHMLMIQRTIHNTVSYTAAVAAVSNNSSLISSNINCGLLLQPLLFCMGPAVTRLLQAAAGERQQPPEGPSRTDATTSVAAAAAESLVPSCDEMRKGLGLLLLAATSGDAATSTPAHLTAAILEQPQAAISSLCMGLRALAAEAAAPTERRPSLLIDRGSHAFALQVAKAVSTACASLCSGCSDGADAAAAARGWCHSGLSSAARRSAQSPASSGAQVPRWLLHTGSSLLTPTPQAAELASPQLQQELLSLMLCCAKVAVLRTHKSDPEDVLRGMCLASAVAAASAATGCLCLSVTLQPHNEADAPICSSSSSSHPVAHNKPWLLLCGRVLNIFGAAAHRLAAMQAADKATMVNPSNCEMGHVSQCFLQNAQQASHDQRRLLSAAEAAEVLLVDPTTGGQAAPTETAAAAAHTRMLLQQQDAVIMALETSVQDFNDLCRVMARSSSGSASIEEATAEAQVLLSRLGKQLQESGAAVCAALPVPYCCNNPGCCSFRGDSEQQLVSGKGCVCGGCQVARYCGKDCQTAHWPQHKAVCKRIKKERAAAT